MRIHGDDRTSAKNCAFWKADAIAGRYATPQATMDEDDDISRKIAWLVYEAIEAYVTYIAEAEADARIQLASAEELGRKRKADGQADIPF